MLTCFSSKKTKATRPLHLVTAAGFDDWLQSQTEHCRAWLNATQFAATPGATTLFPDAAGAVAGAVSLLPNEPDLWAAANAAGKLPAETSWQAETDALTQDDIALAWALQSYRFTRYQPDSQQSQPAQLVVKKNKATARARTIAEAIYLGRDLVNTPAFDMGPDELQAAIETMGAKHKAKIAVTTGKKLQQNFPLIHAVGDASPRRPRLVDLTWGKAKAPKVTLVGKGVCFDTGGLNLKPGGSMALMKKDMGGAAAMIALADAIMGLGLPIRLRLLVPIVENSVSGSAFRPGDVLPSRAGLHVEIGNTDAEGRLILADALDLADAEEPDLLIDAATLTGAARVALGPELPVMFTNDDTLAHNILDAGKRLADPLWPLPLHEPYRNYIKSSIADLNNAGTKPFAGSITAALFLQSFVKRTQSWVHFDIFGYNDQARPGRPQGGEATAMRPLLAVIEALAGAKA